MSQPNRLPPLAALVPAFDPAQAARPIAGVNMLERQLRLLAGVGVGHAVLLVESLSTEMAAVIAGLRGGSMRIDLVPSLADAVPQLGPAARVLLLAEACLPEPGLLDALAHAPVPALATLDDSGGLEHYERIDGGTRWAGVALIDAARVAETAAMLGEWDPTSTLLRRAVQEGAHRIAAGTPPLLASDTAAMADAEQRLLIAARRGRRGWARRRIEGPLSDRILPLLLERGIAREAAGYAAAGLAVAGGLLALLGWRWPALALLLGSGPAMACANQLYALHAERTAGRAAQAYARLGGLALALGGLGFGLYRASGQWGWLLIVAMTAALLGGLQAALLLAKRLGAAIDRPWLAVPGAMPWIMLPFALLGWWGAGTVGVVLYAAVSFVTVGGRLLRPVP